MRIQTGQGTIPLLTLVGIWSISALNALPGLAVSPILGKLSEIFPQATELDLQMLSSLPSLLIIPFILLAGALAQRTSVIGLLQVGLGIFASCGVLYLLADRMWQLIAISAILGIGAGMIVPLSTGLVTKYFSGAYRTKQFGLSSAITNLTLVGATALTGYLAEVNWHLPFTVYLLPLVSLVLSVYLQRSMAGETKAAGTPAKRVTDVETTDARVAESRYGIYVPRLLQLMGFYGLCTFLVLIVVFNLPFLMEEHGFTSGNAGMMISLFFLAIMVPGFLLNTIVKRLGRRTLFFSLLSISVGLGLILIAPVEWLIAPGGVFVGLGYGVIQPLVYDKTTRCALPAKATLALAFVMTMNYLAILLCPFVIGMFQSLLHVRSQEFPFVFNLVLTVLVLAGIERRSHEK
ncbi:MAG: MFS transporter [Bacteroides sp.]